MTLTQRRREPGAAVPPVPDESRFTEVFDACAPRVFAYARRQTTIEDARDVVADTFLVAWRRWDVVPVDDPLPWLLVVARNTLANLRRKRRLHPLPAEDLNRALDRLAPPDGIDTAVAERAELLAALAALTALEREALLLVAWDGLPNRAAAEVAGCSPRAFEVRLSRARARLVRDLRTDDKTPTVSCDRDR